MPHTWQTAPETAEYMGTAWYRRAFHAPAGWKGRTVRIEFEAVYHTAVVRLNGKEVGAHKGKGYTAFALDITDELQYGARNVVEVQVDNSFNDEIMPRGKSFDWTPDGGIYRPVRLLVTPSVYLESVGVDAIPDLVSRTARLDIRAIVRGGSPPVRCEIAEEATGEIVATTELRSGQGGVTIQRPKLWHFDHPHLYRITASTPEHTIHSTFGIRKIELRGASLYLNGERVWLHGVERMAGSHPQYGMAEPSSWIEHDHADMKNLNCVFTRVHWPQDKRVLDYCDRHGILIQEEVPVWGGNTFRGMKGEPSPALMNNALEQLREMIARDRNHPSIFCWGLCNEVNGQNPVAKQFVRRMAKEARALDPHRLLTYASHSLRTTPENDVAGELDFISWNEYWESWQKGTLDDVRRNLEAIRKAFPGKMIVVSEYGYCECAPGHDGGDAKRLAVLKDHNAIFRECEDVGGLIFFCYNDYRTHMGDKGLGVLKQRVHGVVDVYGARKPSYEALRMEASPVESVRVAEGSAIIQTRRRIPAYRLEGYKLRWTVYGFGGLPMEQREVLLPPLNPGDSVKIPVPVASKDAQRVQYDVMRPTGFSAYALVVPA